MIVVKLEYIIIFFCNFKQAFQLLTKGISSYFYMQSIRSSYVECEDMLTLFMNKKIVCRQKGVQLTFSCQKIQKNVFKILRILNDADLLHVFHSQQGKGCQSEVESEQSSIMRNYNYQLNTTEAIQLIWKAASIVGQRGLAFQQRRALYMNQYVGQNNILQQTITKIEQKLSKMSNQSQHQEIVDSLAQLLKETKAQKDKVEKIWKKIKKSIQYSAIQQQLKKIHNSGLFESVTLQEGQKRVVIDHLKRNLIKMDQRLFTSSIMYIYEREDSYCYAIFEQCYPYIKCLKQYLRQLIGKQAYQKGLNRLRTAKQTLKQHSINQLTSSFVICHKCDLLDLHPSLQKEKDLTFQCTQKPNVLALTSTPYAYQQVLLTSNFIKYCQSRSELSANVQYHSFDKYIHPFVRTYHEKCSRYLCQRCFDRQKVSFMKNQIDNYGSHVQEEESNQQQQKNNKEKQCQSTKETKYCPFCACLCTCYRCNILDSFNKLMAVYDFLGGSFEEISEQFVFFNHKHDKIQIILESQQLQKYDKQDEIRPQVPVKRKRGRPKKIKLQDEIEKKEGKQRAPRKPRQVKVKPPQIKFQYQEAPDQDEMDENCEENIRTNHQGDEDEIDSYQIFPQLQNLFTNLLEEENKTFDYDDEGVEDKYGLEDESKAVKIQQVISEPQQPLQATVPHELIMSPFDDYQAKERSQSSELGDPSLRSSQKEEENECD